jgi:hypothetical protein
MNPRHLDHDRYMERVGECYELLRESTVEGVTEIREYQIEKRCSEAVNEHETVGESENQQLNAGIVAVASPAEDALDDTTPEMYESGAEYLADVAHATVKYDLISWVLDRRAEIQREGEAA